MQKIIEYKYIVGQIIYFMYRNEIRKGIISDIQITLGTNPLKTHLTEKIVTKKIQISPKDYPLNPPNILYSIDLINKEGKFGGAIGFRHEEDLYETQEDLINKISIK